MEPKAAEDVLVVDGVPILSGSFHVRKVIFKNATLQSAEPVCPLWLILNLVPTDRNQRAIGADMGRLPLSVQWSSISLLARELILWTCLDRQCFFSTFRLPSCWMRFVTFVQLVHGILVRKKPCTEVHVASVTVAIGWISATRDLPPSASKRASNGVSEWCEAPS